MGNEDNGRELDWNDTIEKDSSDFITLPEGDYDFMVESFDRARHNGSDNLPPCNKAILKIRIDDPAGTVIVTHNLFLHTKVEGLISAFFSSIGQKKKGEQLRMNSLLHAGEVLSHGGDRTEALPERGERRGPRSVGDRG